MMLESKVWYQVHDVDENGVVIDRHYGSDGWSKFYQSKQYDPKDHKAELEAKYPFKRFAIVEVTQTSKMVE